MIGFEPISCRFEDGCSIQLSYMSMVQARGVEPLSMELQTIAMTASATLANQIYISFEKLILSFMRKPAFNFNIQWNIFRQTPFLN